MDNYYNILQVNQNDSIDTIRNSYKKKISIFNKFKELKTEQVVLIKELKKAYYVLSEPELRKAYDESLNPPKDFVYDTNENSNDLDSVFNIDNSWMDNEPVNTNLKKDKNNTNIISDRIFSLSHLNKKQSTSDFLKSNQGRIDA